MLRLLARHWAKITYVFKTEVEAEANALNAKLALRLRAAFSGCMAAVLRKQDIGMDHSTTARKRQARAMRLGGPSAGAKSAKSN
jgi:hypothetical protein